MRPLALGLLAVATLAVGAGALTFIPRWQLAALNPAEAQNVQATLALPALKARAERTRQNADYLAWGKAAFDSGRYDEAVSAYGNALKLNPRQPEALRRLGILLLTRGERGGQAPSAQDATQAALLIRTAAQLAPRSLNPSCCWALRWPALGKTKTPCARWNATAPWTPRAATPTN
ncbi:tetratricopeptide repeat protein [Deinococcus multiflagellatus]|uniref:Tetratricopeptide repeat protein n=1 Tax=Deinococcus multiflagellatus TaxID=1656887 RepID=A0ABW1ZFI5_9DEIO